MLCIKTGMTSEAAIAKRYAAPGILHLSGVKTVADFEKEVPADCRAMISFGLCGGLGTMPQIGQCFLATTMVTPEGVYHADPAWLHRLFTRTHAYEVHWWSSGQFNTANTPAERAALCARTGCQVIDDESAALFEFCAKHGLAAAAMRTVSDGAKDNLPDAVINALNPDGTTDIWAVCASIAKDPAEIPALVKTALEFKKSLDELVTAALMVGPTFQWGA